MGRSTYHEKYLRCFLNYFYFSCLSQYPGKHFDESDHLITSYFGSLFLVISLVCNLCENALAATWIADVACDEFGTDGEMVRQELCKGVLWTKSGRALWSYSRPCYWTWTIPTSKQVFGERFLVALLPGRSRRKTVCTIYSIYINGVFPGKGKLGT